MIFLADNAVALAAVRVLRATLHATATATAQPLGSTVPDLDHGDVPNNDHNSTSVGTGAVVGIILGSLLGVSLVLALAFMATIRPVPGPATLPTPTATACPIRRAPSQEFDDPSPSLHVGHHHGVGEEMAYTEVPLGVAETPAHARRQFATMDSVDDPSGTAPVASAGGPVVGATTLSPGAVVLLPRHLMLSHQSPQISRAVNKRKSIDVGEWYTECLPSGTGRELGVVVQ